MATATKRNVAGLLDEELVNIKELPNILAPRNGKKVHLSAIYRWVRTGLSGVKLDTVVIANERFTTKEALNRFWVKVTEARDGLQAQADAIATPPKSAKKKHF
jgi:hypothetical protein